MPCGAGVDSVTESTEGRFPAVFLDRDGVLIEDCGYPHLDEHLVFMRSSQAGVAGDAAGTAPQRLARWLLGQLHWMVPQGDQPVRTDTVARVAAHLARALPEAAPGTRVLPPDVLWVAAQTPASETVVDDWLAGRPLAGAHACGRW